MTDCGDEPEFDSILSNLVCGLLLCIATVPFLLGCAVLFWVVIGHTITTLECMETVLGIIILTVTLNMVSYAMSYNFEMKYFPPKPTEQIEDKKE